MVTLSAMVSGSFNFRTYVMKPQVLLRLASWVFSIIVFGCLTSARAELGGHCPLYLDNNACNYGIAIGVIAFLALMGLLFLDAIVDRLIDLDMKKRVIILDLAFTALWTLLWFIGFCYMTNRWATTPKTGMPGGIYTNVNSALAFTFFSVITWGALIFFGIRQYRIAGDVHTNQQQQPGHDYPNVGTTGQVPQPPTSQPYQEPFQEQQQPPVIEEKKSEEPPPYIPPNY